MEFLKLLQTHKYLFNENVNVLILDLVKRSQVHDDDKIFNQKMFSVYSEHFPNLKKIEFGTKEYREYEIQYFNKAHEQHAQNRHHFYSSRNNSVNPDLIDLIEAVIDIMVSNLQYSSGNVDDILSVLKSKGIMEISLEKYVKNTLIKLCEEQNAKDISS